jgi:mannobiose 2-epimerase
MIYESDPAAGTTDGERHWWVQAETVVGCLYQYWLSGDPAWLDRALACWSFIKDHLLCPGGEWYWSILPDGTPNTVDDRAGFWKCPYHNGRMCMEIISR